MSDLQYIVRVCSVLSVKLRLINVFRDSAFVYPQKTGAWGELLFVWYWTLFLNSTQPYIVHMGLSHLLKRKKKNKKWGHKKKKHLEAPICLVWRAGRTTASGLWDPAAASPCNTVLPTSTAARVPVHQSPAAHAHLMKTPTQTCPAVSHGCRGWRGDPNPPPLTPLSS